MSDITNYPLQDAFDTTLSQELLSDGLLMYVNSAGNFTFPANITTNLTINPGKTTQEIVKVISKGSNTFVISQRNVPQGASVTTTAKNHGVGSRVIISDNYQFWKDIVDSINSKIDNNAADTVTARTTWSGTNASPVVQNFANSADRDAAFTSPVQNDECSVGGDRQFYNATTLLWTSYDQGTPTPNASTTVAGKKEDPTDAEFLAGTDTGGTGATMSPTPSQVAKAIQNGSFISGVSATGTDAYAINPTPAVTALAQFQMYRVKADVANTPPCTLNVSGLGAVTIKLKDGTDPPSGTIPANSIFEVFYNSTGSVFELQSVSALATTSNTDIGENYRLFLNPINASGTTCAWGEDDVGTGTKTLGLNSNGQVAFATSAASGDREVAWRAFPSYGAGSGGMLFNQLTTGKKIIFEIHASANEGSPTNEELRFGFSENQSQANTETSNVTQAKFLLDDNQAKVIVCDGTGAVTSTNIAVSNQDYQHCYRIEYTVGTSVVFKVDGVTLHTATTNIPLNTDSGQIVAFVGLKTTSAEINSCYFSNDVYIAFQK